MNLYHYTEQSRRHNQNITGALSLACFSRCHIQNGCWFPILLLLLVTLWDKRHFSDKLCSCQAIYIVDVRLDLH